MRYLNDTTLARFIRRQLERTPWMRRIRVLEGHLRRERIGYLALHDQFLQMRDDFFRFLHRPVAAPMSVDADEGFLGKDPVVRTVVHFEPIEISTIPRHRRVLPAPATVEILKEHARKIAFHHAEQHAEEILRLSLIALNAPTPQKERPMPYTPDGAGYRAMDTSHDAAAGTDARKWRAAVLDALREEAMSADQIASKLGVSVLTIRPRVADLKRERLIMDTGRRARTGSGKTAAVWMLNPQESGNV